MGIRSIVSLAIILVATSLFTSTEASKGGHCKCQFLKNSVEYYGIHCRNGYEPSHHLKVVQPYYDVQYIRCKCRCKICGLDCKRKSYDFGLGWMKFLKITEYSEIQFLSLICQHPLMKVYCCCVSCVFYLSNFICNHISCIIRFVTSQVLKW